MDKEEIKADVDGVDQDTLDGTTKADEGVADFTAGEFGLLRKSAFDMGSGEAEETEENELFPLEFSLEKFKLWEGLADAAPESGDFA